MEISLKLMFKHDKPDRWYMDVSSKFSNIILSESDLDYLKSIGAEKLMIDKESKSISKLHLPSPPHDQKKTFFCRKSLEAFHVSF